MEQDAGLTVEEIAAQYRIDPGTVYRWANNWRWIEAISSTRPLVRYAAEQVEELIQHSRDQDQEEEPERPGLTVREIATKYGMSLDTVHGWVRRKEWQEAVVGLRGPAKEYDSVRVEELVRERIWLPPVETGIPAGRALTLMEISEYTGIGYDEVRHMAADVSGRGSVLGEHDDLDGDRRMWKRSTVDERLWGRQRRKKRKQ